MTQLPNYVTPELMVAMSKYLRLTNYLGAAQLYLKDNFLLEQPLELTHLKKRLLGHWGTVPGINFVYLCLNILIKQYSQEMMFIAGPGHGYPALLANLLVDGSLGEHYPELKFSRSAFEKVIHDFSWPGKFPSHANPETPGVILEGGELGYSLSTAFGAALDNPNLIVTCLVGDGEAETGPTAAAWHSIKFIDPIKSGAVLPILHINKYKISGPTIFGTMDDEELIHLFKGYGYEPIIVKGDHLYEDMLTALDNAYHSIKAIQAKARGENTTSKPKWPMILFISKKGWTGPKEHNGLPIEDSFRSHGIPLEHVHTDPAEYQLLKDWLESYNVRELLTSDFELIPEIANLIPDKELRLGMSRHANGGLVRKELILPDLIQNEVKIDQKGKTIASNMEKLGDYLRQIIEKNPDNFRLMSPDETESNKLHQLFNVTSRGYVWPVPFGSENVSQSGRVMEILSEHTLQGWIQGYVLTGRHSILISYEAFMMIVASMVDQYSKFIVQMDEFPWRKKLPSLNMLLTSTTWRQEHNGFSHQNPGFISAALNNHNHNVHVHFPPDANSLLATMDYCFRSTNTINIIVAEKRGLTQYLSAAEAKIQTEEGIMNWTWAGNNQDEADIVFAATGDVATQEIMAAIEILRQHQPDLSTRFISISQLRCFGIGNKRNLSSMSLGEFEDLFTKSKPIIYGYHGYPEDIQQLLYHHPYSARFYIHGYEERGTTTTPFDMLVQNKASRFHLAKLAAKLSKKESTTLIDYCNEMIRKHEQFIEENGTDIPEVVL